MTSKLLLNVALGLGLILAASGCNSGSETPARSASQDESETTPHVDHDHADHDHSANDPSDKTDMEKMTEALADFSEEDRQSAMKQHFCPVSGEMLGTMGAPEEVDVNGKGVWICCEGCKGKLLDEPEKYLAKLKE